VWSRPLHPVEHPAASAAGAWLPPVQGIERNLDEWFTWPSPPPPLPPSFIFFPLLSIFTLSLWCIETVLPGPQMASPLTEQNTTAI
jgi:hypothetical protein